MKGVLSWLVRWPWCAVKGYFCSALAAKICPVQNIFPHHIYCYNSFVPIGQKAGLATVLGRLSLSMFLWLHHTYFLFLIFFGGDFFLTLFSTASP
jgi:hypothetical protein